ncbi:MAG TPA: c-type cytochrome [Vicinamibacterales bacterium]|nr:c-type cytochrome [Vicinamibacterales bacterium]
MSRIDTAIVVLAAGLLMAVAAGPTVRAQQHGYTTDQINQGRALYEANCGRCHNNTGDGVTGVELFKQIRRANSDEGIAKIIQNGIPNTGMPPHQFSDDQAMSVVAFLRAMSGAVTLPAAPNAPSPLLAGGDAARGKTVFEGKGACLQCHAVGGTGGRSGPDLGALGRPSPRRFGGPAGPNVADIEQSILDPNAEIRPEYRVYQVTLKNGQTVKGELLNQDTFSVQLLDGTQRLRSFLKADLTAFGFLDSPMPSYRGTLSDQELKDLVTYLVSLKG